MPIKKKKKKKKKKRIIPIVMEDGTTAEKFIETCYKYRCKKNGKLAERRYINETYNLLFPDMKIPDEVVITRGKIYYRLKGINSSQAKAFFIDQQTLTRLLEVECGDERIQNPLTQGKRRNKKAKRKTKAQLAECQKIALSVAPKKVKSSTTKSRKKAPVKKKKKKQVAKKKNMI